MKKRLYYITPFALVPIIMLFSEHMDNIGLISMSPYILLVMISFCCLVIGNASPINKKFDFTITLIMPLALFCFMFVAGFLDKDDLETRFHLGRAFEVAFQPWCLVVYCAMALITFLASFEAIRIAKKLRKH